MQDFAEHPKFMKLMEVLEQLVGMGCLPNEVEEAFDEAFLAFHVYKETP